jgi:Uma2 family endonuclease
MFRHGAGTTRTPVTVDELLRIVGRRRVEIVNEDLVIYLPSGHMRAYAAGEIFISLHTYARRIGIGLAVTDNATFRASRSSHVSFSPDVAYYVGPIPRMESYPVAPVFAVEIRSVSDYDSVAEREIADKRADYFDAGTEVVWDVDLLRPDTVRKYTARSPKTPAIFRRGDVASAEPAVPGWTIPVETLFL